jgi:hypothetical protein
MELNNMEKRITAEDAGEREKNTCLGLRQSCLDQVPAVYRRGYSITDFFYAGIWMLDNGKWN